MDTGTLVVVITLLCLCLGMGFGLGRTGRAAPQRIETAIEIEKPVEKIVEVVSDKIIYKELQQIDAADYMRLGTHYKIKPHFIPYTKKGTQYIDGKIMVYKTAFNQLTKKYRTEETVMALDQDEIIPMIIALTAVSKGYDAYIERAKQELGTQ